jgi:hypothetical protein
MNRVMIIVLISLFPMFQVSCSRKQRESECDLLAQKLKNCDKKSKHKKIKDLVVECEHGKKKNSGKLSPLYSCVKSARKSCRRVKNCINVKLKRHLKNNKVGIRKSVSGKSRAGSLNPVIDENNKKNLKLKKSSISKK